MTTLDTPRPAPSLPLELTFGLVLGSTVILALMTWRPEAALDGLDYLLRRWHVPTVLTQLIFCAAAVLNPACRQGMAGLTRWQAGMLCLLALYVGWRSLTAPFFGSWAYGIWWLVQIAFLVALLGALRAGLMRPGALWLGAGVVAMAHLCLLIVAVHAVIWPEGVVQRWSPPGFSNIRHPGYLMAAAAAGLAGAHAAARRPHPVALVFVGAAVFYICLTGGRGAAIALLLGLGAAFTLGALLGTPLPRRRLLELGAVALGALVLPELTLDALFHTILDRFVENVATGGHNLDSGRRALWLKTTVILEAHWLWGTGPTALAFVNTPETGIPFNHPHNLVLQVLIHWGVAGTLLLAGVVASFLAPLRLAKALRASPIAVAVIVTMGAHAMIDGGLYYPFSVALFLLAVAELVMAGDPAKS